MCKKVTFKQKFNKNENKQNKTKIIHCTDNKETLGILTNLSEHCDYFMSGSSCAKRQWFFSVQYSLTSAASGEPGVQFLPSCVVSTRGMDL